MLTSGALPGAALIPQIIATIRDHAIVQVALWSLLPIALGLMLSRRHASLSNALQRTGHIGLLVALVLTAAQLLHVPLTETPGIDQPQQTTTGTETRVRLAPDGHFWVRARANGAEQRLLVDTGATLTTLSATTANAMGAVADPEGGQVTLTTANGTTHAALGLIPTLRIGTIVVHHLPVAVAPGMAETNVLGMNFLLQLASWRVDNNTLTLVPHHPQVAGEGESER